MTTLVELQSALWIGMVNPDPPLDLCLGELAFCTAELEHVVRLNHYMWMCITGKDDSNKDDLQYRVQIDDGPDVWVKAKYFFTKAQAQEVLRKKTNYVPPWEDNLVLPLGVQVEHPDKLVQAVLNFMRDANVIGRAGQTNLPSVKCDVSGVCLGHFYKLSEALGSEVSGFIADSRKTLKKD